ncbi:hypothetical protein ABH926_006732 [Catenulispora sp. GP43]|uniref:phosphotransferase n=1 Tax=Catenulispora sp. GP43 TaxID=3156263 RepID=UPI00351472E1
MRIGDAPLGSARLAEHGNLHYVVLFPGVAAVRISRRPSSAAELPRRTEILRGVEAAGLPFAVPVPLTAVTPFGERVAVAVSWADILGDEVIPRLPPKWRDGVRRRLDALLALDDVPAGLVHGDLGGGDIHFGRDGKLVGVLDWDVAILSDPAIDAALAATWQGWDVLRAATDEQTCRRAWAWNDAIEAGHLHAVFANKSLESVDGFVSSIVAWFESR